MIKKRSTKEMERLSESERPTVQNASNGEKMIGVLVLISTEEKTNSQKMLKKILMMAAAGLFGRERIWKVKERRP